MNICIITSKKLSDSVLLLAESGYEMTLLSQMMVKENAQLVKNWIIAGEKLGAPVIRLFAGHADTTGLSRQKAQNHLVVDMKSVRNLGKIMEL